MKDQVNVVITGKWFDACSASQSELKIKNPLVLTSGGNQSRLRLEEKFSSEMIYSLINPNPTHTSCAKAIDFSHGVDFDGVIAIGGGSVMDTTKFVIASMRSGMNDVNQLLNSQLSFNRSLPSIFIPTTHGSGSEVTMWATIWDFEQENKYSLSHPELYPDVAILDGSLALSLPLDISITTVLDALSHSFESIWNKNKNSESSEYAIQSIVMIIENIDKLKKNPLNLEVRENLLIASNLAGLAFSTTKTAAAHSISYPLTIYFNIPHGIASSITLPQLLKINQSSILPELKMIYQNLNISGIDELIELIYNIPQSHIKFTLGEWGVKPEEIDFLTSKCFATDRIENNIIKLEENDVRSILEDCS